MHEVTRILSAIEHGDPQAAEQLLPLVYDELRKLAAARKKFEDLNDEYYGLGVKYSQQTGVVHPAVIGKVLADGQPVETFGSLWWALALIISCGTIAGALIPEFTKIFTSTKSRHCQEVVNSARQGGASLTILSGFVAGNFSAFWEGLVILALMLGAYLFSLQPAFHSILPEQFAFAAPIFAFIQQPIPKR